MLTIGKDVIGLAETGSGKTAAFAIPILQALLENPQRYFALILTPTRELAFQISEQFEAIGKFSFSLTLTKPVVRHVLIMCCNVLSGAGIGVKCAVIVGGMDMMAQALMLAKKPHILIATPGRLVDHLENTKGFNLRALKFLVRDLLIYNFLTSKCYYSYVCFRIVLYCIVFPNLFRLWMRPIEF